mmetsp:Transcript_20473/g.45552  ORF Transcript_20473/g.45552 Transcript_20473/m.45552 type:complete len:1419 (+) Transcript_20473:89-4345(+)
MDKYSFEDEDSDGELGAFSESAIQKSVSSINGGGTHTSFKAPVALAYSKSLETTANPVRAGSHESQSVKLAFADRDITQAEENLGFNFYASPWLPPDEGKAIHFRAVNVYGGAIQPLNRTTLIENGELGAGLNSYFQLFYSVVCGFFAMTVFALPALCFAWFGSAIPSYQSDLVGLSSLSIANVGYDVSSFAYGADSACTGNDFLISGANLTCVQVMGSEYSMGTVSLALSVLDVLQIVVFLIMVMHVNKRLRGINYEYEHTGVPSITDYSVHVTNLPTDTTLVEIVEHFSKLYQLEEVDWRGRIPVEDAGVVDSTDYGRDNVYLDTWVAKCTICTKVKSVVNYLEQRRKLMEQLYVARAYTKMYRHATIHRKGYQAKKHEWHEKRMLKIAAKIDHLHSKIRMKYEEKKESVVEPLTREETSISVSREEETKSQTQSEELAADRIVHKSINTAKRRGRRAKSTSVLPIAEDSEKAPAFLTSKELTTKDLEAAVPKAEKINHLQDDAPSMAVFICFEYNESMARCVEDYKYYAYRPSCFYPKELRFKGRKLVVEKAIEPDEIIYENIEVGTVPKMLAKLLTYAKLVLVLLLSFTVLYVAATIREEYEAQLPVEGLCGKVLPQLYATTSNYKNDTMLSRFELTRTPSRIRAAADASCEAVIPDSFYAVYTDGGEYGDPVATFDAATCSTSVCPSVGDASYCPCLSADLIDGCKSASCSEDGGYGECLSFAAGDVARCYCTSVLERMLVANGVGGALSWLVSYLTGSPPDVTGECEDAKYWLGSSTAAVCVAAVIAAALNHAIKLIVLSGARAEHPGSTGERDEGIAWKIFLFSFLNMAGTCFVAFGLSTVSASPYEDFQKGWFSTAGFYLVATFALTSLPHIPRMYWRYSVSLPYKNFRAFKEVSTNNGDTYAAQHQLNKIQIDSKTFDVRVRTGQVLAWVFTAMTYSAGVPLMVPLAAFSLLMLFRNDKYYLLRFYKRPDEIGKELALWALRVLPYAAVVKVFASCFIFSSRDVMPFDWSAAQSSDSTLETYFSNVESIKNDHYFPAFLSALEDRMLRPNTFPLFVVLLLMVAVRIARSVWGYLPPVAIFRLIKICLCERWGYRASTKEGVIHPYDLTFHSGDPNRNQEAPLSGGYSKHLRHADDKPVTCFSSLCPCFCQSCYQVPPITESELGARWEVLVVDRFEVKIKTWPQKFELVDGSIKKSGEQKYTYDLICEQHCNSFELEAMPQYKMSGITLRKEPFVPIVPDYLAWKKRFETQLAHKAEVEAEKTQREITIQAEKIRTAELAMTELTTAATRAHKKEKQLLHSPKAGHAKLFAELDAAVPDEEEHSALGRTTLKPINSKVKAPVSFKGKFSAAPLPPIGRAPSSSSSSDSSSDSSSSSSDSSSSSSSDSSDEEIASPALGRINEEEEASVL